MAQVGQISLKLKQSFEEINQDKSGEISLKEFKQLMQRISPNDEVTVLFCRNPKHILYGSSSWQGSQASKVWSQCQIKPARCDASVRSNSVLSS
jgi:hypothetical protein